MIKKIFILFVAITLVSNKSIAQQIENNQTKFPEVMKINPLTFDMTEISQIDLDELKNRAYEAMLQQDFTLAARFYLYIISHDLSDANSHYNLARCYAYLGQSRYASNFLIMAINEGFNNFTFIKEDAAFKTLMQDSYFYTQFQAVQDFGEKIGENIYVKGEKLMKCRVLLPDNYQSDKAYPLVIGMHGFGGTAEEFTRLWSGLTNRSFIFVIPEGPYEANPDAYRRNTSFSWDIGVRSLELYKRSDNLSSEFIVNIKKYMAQNYSIDKNYILGFSQGGGYAYVTGIKNPDHFEGIICFGARLPDYEKYPWFLSEKNIEKGNKLKVFIAHGKEDGNVNKSAVAAKKILKKFDYDVKLQLFEGGHFVSLPALESALEWMDIQ